MYFNYHAKIKKLIKENNLQKVKIVERYNNISPAMVLFFKDSAPMPVREYRWGEYFALFNDIAFDNVEIDSTFQKRNNKT